MESKDDTENHPGLAGGAPEPASNSEEAKPENREVKAETPQTHRRPDASPAAHAPVVTGGFRRQDWTFIFEGIVAVATVVGILFLWRQSSQTERALKQAELATTAAQRQVEISDRAWVQARVQLNGPFLVNGDSVMLRLIVATRNTGGSVANDVTVTTEAFGRSNEFDEPLARQKGICDAARKRPENNVAKSFGSVLFPDEEELRPHGYGISRTFAQTDFAAGMREMFKVANPAIVMVVGCVTYWYEASDRAHQTGFIYEVSKRPSPDPSMPPWIGRQSFLDLDKLATLPVDEIVVRRSSGGGFYAN